MRADDVVAVFASLLGVALLLALYWLAFGFIPGP